MSRVALRVQAFYSDQSQIDVTDQAGYSVTDPNVCVVQNDGVVVALNQGDALIRASYAGFEAIGEVTVNGPLMLVGVQVVPTQATLEVQQTLQLSVLANYSDGSSQEVTQSATYQSFNQSVAQVDESGLIRAQGPGQALVTATFYGFSGACQVEVEQPFVKDLLLVPESAELEPGDTLALALTAFYSDGSSLDVTLSARYQSADESVASVNTQGVVQAHASGQTEIAATFAGLTKNCEVRVPAPALLDVTVQPDSAQLEVGQTLQLVVQAHYADGSVQSVAALASYLVEEPGVASVSSLGVVSALTTGQTSIQASFGGLRDECVVRVVPPQLEGLQVQPKATQLEIGQSVQLVVRGRYSDGSEIPLTEKATYLADAPSVVSVTETGLVLAQLPGTALVTASFGGFQDSATVEVLEPSLVRVELVPSSVALQITQEVLLEVRAFFSDGSELVVTDLALYRSDQPSVASVNGQGKIRAKKPGKTVVTATFEGLSDTCQVEVLPANPVGIRVLPDSLTLQQGQSQQLVVWIDYEDGSQEDVTAAASFVSSDANVASVEQGLVQALTTGSARIDVDHLGFQGECQVSVVPPVLESIQILPQEAHIGLEDQLQFQVLGFYSDGSQLDLTDSDCLTTYDSSDEGVLTVDGQGLASPVWVGGPVSITARNGEFWSIASVTVLENPVPVVDSLDPSQVLYGVVGDQVSVWGSGFLNASVVQVDGRDLVTSLVGPGQLSAVLDGQATSEVGIHSITVKNPAPGGGVSQSRELWVISAPSVDSVTPSMGLTGKSIRVGIYGKGLLGCELACDNPGVHVSHVRYHPTGTYLFVTLTIDQSAALGLAQINLSNIAGVSVADFTVLADEVFPDCVVEAGEVMLASGVYTCNDVVVETGALIIGTGLEPLQVLATGVVTILGDMQVSGFSGADGYYNPAQGGASGPGGAGGGGAGDGDLGGHQVASGGLGSPPGQDGQGDQGAGTPSGAGGGVGAG